MEIGELTERDVGDAHTLSVRAGWDFRERDWQHLLTLSSVHAVVGRLDGDLVATATAIVYDPQAALPEASSVAWIGSMLVEESSRRQGYGTEIFEAVLSLATDRAEVVGLDANELGKRIYEDAGFVDVAEAAEWNGTLDTAAPSIEIEECTDPSEISTFDARVYDVDRSNLLQILWTDPTSRGFVRRTAGGVTGYVLVRPSLNGWTVGPLVADDPDAVGDLLAAVGGVTEDDPVTLNVVGNPGVDEYYRDAGLERVRTLTRMTYDEPTRSLMGERVRAIPGFAFG